VIAKASQHSHSDSAYGGYELLRSLLVEEEEMSGLQMDDVIVANTNLLIKSSGGNGKLEGDH
jgi:hypothetical protein